MNIIIYSSIINIYILLFELYINSSENIVVEISGFFWKMVYKNLGSFWSNLLDYLHTPIGLTLDFPTMDGRNPALLKIL